MAYKITINVEDFDDLSIACEEVANAIECGYKGGIIGFSGDTWNLEKV